MATDCNRLKTCEACKKRCLLIHSAKASTSTVSSFFKVMDDQCSPFLEIPSFLAKQIQSDGCRYAIVEGPTGYIWESILCCCGTSPSFKSGWKNFVSYHAIQAGDIMVFRNMRETHFVVQIFHSSGYEQQITHKKELPKVQIFHSSGYEQQITHKKELPKVQIFHSSGYEKQITHKKELPKQKGCDLYRNQTQQWLSAEHLIILDSDLEDHFDQKAPLPSYSHVNHNAYGKPNLCSIVNRNLRSAVKKDPTNQPSTSDVKPGNPKKIREFSKVIKKAAVNDSFWLSVPVKFARQWLPQTKVKVVLLCQRKKWLVTYVGNRKEIGIGPGWKAFVIDNQIKVGDTCNFELKNTTNHVFAVKIFRG